MPANRKSERIHLDMPIGSGREGHEWALRVALSFSAEFADRQRGRHRCVIYAGAGSNPFDVAVWWTKTGTISVSGWRRHG